VFGIKEARKELMHNYKNMLAQVVDKEMTAEGRRFQDEKGIAVSTPWQRQRASDKSTMGARRV
jgi:hypothetical protein